MKHQFTCAVVVGLTVALSSKGETSTATNGVILIATRFAQDSMNSTEYVTAEWGPGMVTPGDVSMGNLLADYGYSFRLVLDRLLDPANAQAWGQDASVFLAPTDPNLAPSLIILSGSSSSADIPPPNTNNIPVMMGEHVTLGNNAGRAGSIYMYDGTESSDPNQGTGASKYMKVVAPDHPILQGIPLDAQGRVKIFRDPYPEESLYVPTPANPADKRLNYEYRWCTQKVTNAAPATTVLAVLDGDESRACFAVAEAGGLLANGEKNPARKVHLFTNEQGSGGPRRVFLALTEWGRILFVRAAKWAMGETLSPYPGFRILDVTPAGVGRIDVLWQGAADKNYQFYATTDLLSSRWQPVAGDISGSAGTLSRTFDISAAPLTLFLRLQAIP